jgi:hypothetical protein
VGEDFRLELVSGISGTCCGEVFEQRASYLWMVVGTVCIGAFIGQVDASIVQLAMPTLEDAFEAPLHAVGWVLGSGVGVASASVVLGFRLGTATGVSARTAGVPATVLFAAVNDTLVMLAAFAALAAATVIVRKFPAKPV